MMGIHEWQIDDCPGVKGLWTIRPHDGTVHGDTSKPIATVYDEDHARLIAAAPDLLAALEKALSMCLALNAERPAYYDNASVARACTIADARRAIAKAAGE